MSWLLFALAVLIVGALVWLNWPAAPPASRSAISALVPPGTVAARPVTVARDLSPMARYSGSLTGFTGVA